jgi:hypothetical protein
MEARGEHSARAAQVATLETRKAKADGVPLGRLREEWRSRAAEHGLTARRVERLVGIRRSVRTPRATMERTARRLEGSRGLTLQRSTFTRGEVLQAFAEAAVGGATVEEIETQADAFLARATVVELEPDGGERRFTTGALLAVEQLALDRARTGATSATSDAHAVEAALAARPSLSEEQRELVRGLTLGDRAVAAHGHRRAADNSGA